MPDFSSPVFWILLLAVLAAAWFGFRGFFGREARERRRRQRSHGKVVSKVTRPMVKLAVEGEAGKKVQD